MNNSRSQDSIDRDLEIPHKKKYTHQQNKNKTTLYTYNVDN